MYNLLVSYSGWASNRDTINRGRVFEYTEDAVLARFVNDGRIDRKVNNLPTLFVTESGGGGPQYARVGTITSMKLVGDDCHIEYVFDDAPPIPNSVLEEHSAELGIAKSSFEFTRTHWAIKDVDLYRVLFRIAAASRPVPSVFQFPNQPVEDDLVSVMMPFGGGFDRVYKAIQEAAHNEGMRCQRADDIWDADVIINDVVSLIHRSAVLVCDLSDKNANVFYETGIAHTLGKKVILITQHESDVPFDLRHIRHVRYLNNGEGVQTLARKIEARLRLLQAQL